MAITISNVLNGGGAPSGGANTTASWTPDGTSQYLLTVSAYVSTGSVVPAISSVTGNGLTWTQLKVVNGDNTGADRTAQYLYVVPAGGSAGAVTINWSTVPGAVSWVLDKVAGANSAIGSGTLIQPAVSGTSSGANPSATLANALASGSVSYAAACFESSAGTLSAGTGYTALGQNTAQSLAWSFTEWNSAGSTTAAANNSTVSNRHSIILIEVDIAVSSNNWTQTPTDTLGLSDSVSVSKGLAQTDSEGLTDGGTQLGHLLSGTDPETLTDATALTQGKAATDTLGLSDSVAISGSFKYLTSRSSNGRYFVDQNGDPFLVRGDAPWALPVKLSASQVDTYISSRLGYGFNTVIVSIIGNTVNGGPSDNGATFDGILPFTGGDPTVFNSTYWSRMDTFIQKFRDAGITMVIYPIDGWTTLSGGVFDPASVNTTQAQTYGNTLATRYPQATYPNIVWGFGGDYSETTTLNNLMNACLTGIRATGDTRLCTVQLMYEKSLSQDSTFWEPKVDFNFVYTYYVTYKGMKDGWDHTWSTSPTTKPAIFGEGAYDGSTDASHPGTQLVVRRQAGWALTSGSPGEFAGQEGVWNFTGSWATLMTSTAMSQLKAIRDAIQNVAWWKLIPDDSNVLVTAGRGTRITADTATYPTGNTYVTAARAGDKSLGVIYLPNAASAITVDMTQIGANPTATWVDPTNGATSSATVGSTYSKGNNAAGSTDWLLILTGDPSGTNSTQTPVDSEGLSDAQAFSQAKTISDLFGLSDAVALAASYAQTPADNEGLTDAVAVDQSKILGETQGLTDSLLIEKGLLSTVADTEGLSDSAIFTANWGQAPTDSEGLTDSAVVASDLSVSSTDQMGLTDTAQLVGSWSQAPTDAMGLSDSAQTSLSSAGSISTTDNLSIADGLTVDQGHALTDALGLTDAVASTVARGIIDPSNLADAVALSISQQPADHMGLTDSAATSLVSAGAVNPTDVENLTDSTVFSQAHLLADDAGLSDAVTLLLNSVKSIIDNAALTDVVQVLLTLPPTSGTAEAGVGSAPRLNPEIGAVATTTTGYMNVPTATGG